MQRSGIGVATKLADIAPRLARARDQILEERRLARERRRRLIDDRLRLDRLVAHRELQYIRALKTGRRRYMDTRARKLEEARAARARLEDAA